MPGLLFHHYRLDEFGDLFVAGPDAQKKLQIVVLLAEQAGAELSVGGETDARAEAAERLANRCNQSDFAGGAIGKAVFSSSLAAFVGDLHERPLRVNAALDFRGGVHQVAVPGAVGVDRHELTGAHDDAAVAGKGYK